MFLQELKNNIYTAKAGMQFMQMKFHEEFHNLGRVYKKYLLFFFLYSFIFSFRRWEVRLYVLI